MSYSLTLGCDGGSLMGVKEYFILFVRWTMSLSYSSSISSSFVNMIELQR